MIAYPLVVGAALALLSLSARQPAQPSQPPPHEPPPAQGVVPPGHPQIPTPRPAEDWPKAEPADVATIESTIAAMYESSSGPKGQARNWDRYKSLFLPDARMIPARAGQGGAAGAFYLSVGDYIEANRTYFERGGFFDRQVAQRVESFGQMAHVWSTFESRRGKDDPAPYVRGINSIQLLKDGDRWWIVNVFWDFERAENPLPEKYQTTPAP